MYVKEGMPFRFSIRVVKQPTRYRIRDEFGGFNVVSTVDAIRVSIERTMESSTSDLISQLEG